MNLLFLINIVCTIVTLSLPLAGKAFSPLCHWNPWEIRSCQAAVTHEDGTVQYLVFQPKNKTISTCYRFGCHPLYCSSWRKDITKSCANEYKRLLKSGALPLREKGKKIVSVDFNGCAHAPFASGVLSPFDRLVRRYAPESYNRACTTDTPEEEWSVRRYLASLWNRSKKAA